MSGTEIIDNGTMPGSVSAWKNLPSVHIGALIEETLADLSYDETRAICYQETIERACAGDRLSQRYMMIADPSGDDATGRIPDLSDDEIAGALSALD